MQEVAKLEAVAFRQTASGDLTLPDLIALAAEITKRFDAGVDGVVVTQGTDTIEETSFALDLLVHRPRPVVVTGAMRNPTLAGPDGPSNLLAAVQVAATRMPPTWAPWSCSTTTSTRHASCARPTPRIQLPSAR